MHADICEPDDVEAMTRLRDALQSIGAELIEQSWAIGVDLYRYRVGSAKFTIFADAWSVDIEGPEMLVDRIRVAVVRGY